MSEAVTSIEENRFDRAVMLGFGVEAYSYAAVPLIAAAFVTMYCFAILPFTGMPADTREEPVQ